MRFSAPTGEDRSDRVYVSRELSYLEVVAESSLAARLNLDASHR